MAFDAAQKYKASDALTLLESIKISEDTPFNLHSGGTSHILIDAISMITQPGARAIVLEKLNEEVMGNKIDAIIVGIETGGALVAAMLAASINTKFGIIRKDNTLIMPKRNPLVSSPEHVIVVEDVITTGNSTDNAVEVLRRNGYHVVQTVCVFDRRTLERDANVSSKDKDDKGRTTPHTSY